MPSNKPPLASKTGRDDWYTPDWCINLAEEVMGRISLDPASCEEAQETINAHVFYSEEDDGLSRPWRGKVWLNPPYSDGLLSRFIDKAIEEFDAGHVEEAIILTNNCTETEWAQKLTAKAAAVCYPKARIVFSGPHSTGERPTRGQFFSYLGPNPKKFAEVFKDVGVITFTGDLPAMEKTENLEIWAQLERTDPNPIMTLTRTFGPCGFGWRVGDVEFTERDCGDGNVLLHCALDLYVRQDDAWSYALPGSGGAFLVRRGQADAEAWKRAEPDAEAWKRAKTNAMRNAMELLGLTGDVYMGDGQKKPSPQQQQEPQKPALPVHTSCDPGRGDATSLSLHQRVGGEDQFTPALPPLPSEKQGEAITVDLGEHGSIQEATPHRAAKRLLPWILSGSAAYADKLWEKNQGWINELPPYDKTRLKAAALEAKSNCGL